MCAACMRWDRGRRACRDTELRVWEALARARRLCGGPRSADGRSTQPPAAAHTKLTAPGDGVGTGASSCSTSTSRVSPSVRPASCRDPCLRTLSLYTCRAGRAGGRPGGGPGCMHAMRAAQRHSSGLPARPSSRLRRPGAAGPCAGGVAGIRGPHQTPEPGRPGRLGHSQLLLVLGVQQRLQAIHGQAVQTVHAQAHCPMQAAHVQDRHGAKPTPSRHARHVVEQCRYRADYAAGSLGAGHTLAGCPEASVRWQRRLLPAGVQFASNLLECPVTATFKSISEHQSTEGRAISRTVHAPTAQQLTS